MFVLCKVLVAVVDELNYLNGKYEVNLIERWEETSSLIVKLILTK